MPNYFASGHEDSSIKIWNFENTKNEFNLANAHKYAVNNLLLLSKHNMLVSSSLPDIKLWDISTLTATLECKHTFRDHTSWVNALVYLNDEKFISSSYDKTIRVWDIKTFSCEKIINTGNIVPAIIYLSFIKDVTDLDLIMTGTLGKTSEIIDLKLNYNNKDEIFPNQYDISIIKLFNRKEAIYKMEILVCDRNKFSGVNKNPDAIVFGCQWNSSEIKLWGDLRNLNDKKLVM